MLFSQNKFLEEKKYWLPTIILAAFILRLIVVIKYGDFWDDEMFNFNYSQRPWLESFKFWIWETNPPLHLIILKFWFYLFPTTEFFTRLPSIIAGTVSIYALYLLAKEIFNHKVALLSSLLLAVQTYHIFWSATARIYSILMLLSILSTLYFYKIFISKAPPNRFSHKQFAAINFLLIFSHLSSIFLLAGQFITLIIIKDKKNTWQWIKNNLIPFSAGIVWIGTSLYLKSNNDLSNSWFVNIEHNLVNALNPLINITAGVYPTISGGGLLLLFITIILLTLYKNAKIDNYNLKALLLLSTLPILIPYVLGIWHVKFFTGVLPLFSIIITYSLLFIFEYRLVAAFAIVSVGLFSYYNLLQILPLTDWTKTKENINIQDSKNSAFIYNAFNLKPQIDRYWQSSNSSKPTIPLILYENMAWDDMIVKKNYIYKKITEEEKDVWYQKNNLNKYDRITLLQGEYSYMNELNNLLSRHNYTIVNGPIKAPVNGNYNLYFYEKDKRPTDKSQQPGK